MGRWVGGYVPSAFERAANDGDEEEDLGVGEAVLDGFENGFFLELASGLVDQTDVY